MDDAPCRPRDHYAALGVAARASPREVARAMEAWRERARGGAVSREELLRAEEAHLVLGDPALRARHDRQTGRCGHPAWEAEDRKSTRLNSSHNSESRMPSSA
jgi:DnaJ-class molecular chaperone